MPYTIAFDAGDDNLFRGDLTPDVLDAVWRVGMRDPFDTVAPIAQAAITVRNPDGRYSPENPASELQIGLALKIVADDPVNPRLLFRGVIAGVRPAPGEYGERVSVITAECPLRGLYRSRVRLNALLNVRAGAVINAVLDRVPTRARYLAGAFIVGFAGRAELGVNTRLPLNGGLTGRNIATGQDVFAYVGDHWDDGVRAIDAVREVAEAERGRFFAGRSGGFTFYDRHTLFTRASAAAFRDDMDGLRITYGTDVVSKVRVSVRPRRVSEANAVLWRLGQAQRIRAGLSRLFTARFRGESGERVGALTVQPPRPFTDYTANSLPDGSGSDLTPQVSFGLLGYDASTAEMRLINTSTVDAYLLPGSVIRGRALTFGAPITVETRSAESETFYGPREFTLRLPGQTSIEAAESIARYELLRRAQPRGTVREMTLHSQFHHPQMIARTLFDRITLTEAQSAHSSDYFIVAESHRITGGGYTHTVTWTLEPADPGTFWQVGIGTLGADTRLAY